jgi:hypothetical protein
VVEESPLGGPKHDMIPIHHDILSRVRKRRKRLRKYLSHPGHGEVEGDLARSPFNHNMLHILSQHLGKHLT